MRPSLSRNHVLKYFADFHIALGWVDLQQLIENGFEGATDEEIVFDWIVYEYAASSNQILAEIYEFIARERVTVFGVPQKLFACPCCHRHTLTEPGNYDICRWCNWEDDGTVDPTVSSSVNGKSMVQCRKDLEKQERDRPFHRWL